MLKGGMSFLGPLWHQSTPSLLHKLTNGRFGLPSILHMTHKSFFFKSKFWILGLTNEFRIWDFTRWYLWLRVLHLKAPTIYFTHNFNMLTTALTLNMFPMRNILFNCENYNFHFNKLANLQIELITILLVCSMSLYIL